MSSLLDKFRGCMIGGVIGDCLGSPMECQVRKNKGLIALRLEDDFSHLLFSTGKASILQL